MYRKWVTSQSEKELTLLPALQICKRGASSTSLLARWLYIGDLFLRIEAYIFIVNSIYSDYSVLNVNACHCARVW